jgi:hypothetical protein
MGQQNPVISTSYPILNEILQSPTEYIVCWSYWFTERIQKERLLNKFKPAKKICEERILKLKGNWRLLHKV